MTKFPSDSLATNAPTLSRRALLRAATLATAGLLAGLLAGCRTSAPRPTATTTPTSSPALRTHRILTCNILLDLPEHKGTPFDWAAGRRDACLDLIRSRHPDIVCMQEVGFGQNDDLARAFPRFAAFGYDDPYVATHPKRFQSIKNVILFSLDRYEQLSGGTYWLSPTPHTPGSRLPGEGLPRHFTWLLLRDRATGRHFRVTDTHWGLKQPTRLQEATMLAAETQKVSPDLPQLLCGDFNSTATSPEQKILRDAGWHDTYAAVHGTDDPHPATRATTAPAAPPKGRIDFIFYRGPIRPVAATIFRTTDPHHPASDHPFVSADVEF